MELISRDDAKRKITEELDSIDHVPGWVFRRLERVINSLPTIEERKEGHWIDTGENLHKCTNCGHIIFSQTQYDLEEFHAYCGRCGARMKGE